MALRINYNFQADFTHVNLLKTEKNLNTALERLSTGYRINSAKDDAAGLFIADQLRLVAEALDQGSRNAQDGISAAQIAESSLAQIYDKLLSIYTKAEQAASDTNDTNARLALQRDINKLVDAIDRIASASEFNGIKLLDGTFKDKYIHYGARAEQYLSVSIDSARAKDLGAYILKPEKGPSTADNTKTYSSLISGNWKFGDTSDKIEIAGIDITQDVKDLMQEKASVTQGAVDAKFIADAINKKYDLQKLGIEASARNVSVAQHDWKDIQVGDDDTVTIKFFVGPRTDQATFEITYNKNERITLDDLINKINSYAASKNVSLRAKAENNKLVLETDGETIGIEVTITDKSTNSGTTTKVDLGAFIQLEDDTELSEKGGSTANGSAVKVGTLTITAPETFHYNFNGITDDKEGLGIKDATGDATFTNLNSLDVRDNEKAELAIKIVDITIKKVDALRSKLGSIQINLQSIIENNNFAATQTREAESRIRNVDFAKEMAEFTRQQTLMQSGMAMLAQANQLPQLVLQLLR